ncbi:MAG TPA: nucleotide exchange factor GrpE [Jatrophihabitans sp.]|nr:nucleotide exchange factor GrpE [Jatrophihabitans sp.]
MTSPDAARSEEQERVVIRDKRKIDPVTGEARKASPETAAAAPAPEAAEATDVPQVDAALLDERTRDLQRVQAEYANYRKRADRDRLAAGEIAVGRTLGELLPVLDDVDRARAHGDLTGALKAVADHLEAVFAKLGLESFGDVGDPFDPALHEAVMHDESDAVTEPTCTSVLRKGYRHRDRLLRPAMVGVTDPAAPPGLGESQGTVVDAEVTTDPTEASPQEDVIPPQSKPAE